jgi:glyoxylase-like metal-dependent hydrolase (beta-lactamase superfamily II)
MRTHPYKTQQRLYTIFSKEKSKVDNMTLEIYPLPLVSCEDYSDLHLLMDRPPKKSFDITYSFYIKGSTTPIIVDSGVPKGLHAEYGWKEWSEPGWDLIEHLERFNVKPENVGYVIHTHLHMDHCGLNDLFPNAKFVVQRRELEVAAVPRIPAGLTIKNKAWYMLCYDRQIISKFVGEYWNRRARI